MKKTYLLQIILIIFCLQSCFMFPTEQIYDISNKIDVTNQNDTISIGDTIWFKSQIEPNQKIFNKTYDISDLSIPFAIMIKQFKGNDTFVNFDSTIPTTTAFDFVPVYLDNVCGYGTNSIYSSGRGGQYKMKDDKLTAEVAFVAKDTGSYIFSALTYDILYKQIVNKKDYIDFSYTFNFDNSHKLNSSVIRNSILIDYYYTVIVK